MYANIEIADCGPAPPTFAHETPRRRLLSLVEPPEGAPQIGTSAKEHLVRPRASPRFFVCSAMLRMLKWARFQMRNSHLLSSALICAFFGLPKQEASRRRNGPLSGQMGPLFENGFFLLKPMARGHPLPRPGTLPPPIGDRFQQVVEDVEPYY